MSARRIYTLDTLVAAAIVTAMAAAPARADNPITINAVENAPISATCPVPAGDGMMGWQGDAYTFPNFKADGNGFTANAPNIGQDTEVFNFSCGWMDPLTMTGGSQSFQLTVQDTKPTAKLSGPSFAVAGTEVTITASLSDASDPESNLNTFWNTNPQLTPVSQDKTHFTFVMPDADVQVSIGVMDPGMSSGGDNMWVKQPPLPSPPPPTVSNLSPNAGTDQPVGGTMTFTGTVDRAASNQPPVTSPSSGSTAVGTAVDITLNASDPESDPLSFALALSPRHGTVSIANNVATYTPNPSYTGHDGFIYSVFDGHTYVLGAANVVVGSPTNGAPSMTLTPTAVPYNTPKTFTVPVTDPDGDPTTLTFGSPTYGSFTQMMQDTFTPPSGYFGVSDLGVIAEDNQQNATAGVQRFNIDKAPIVSLIAYDITNGPRTQIGSSAAPGYGTTPVSMNFFSVPSGYRTLVFEATDAGGQTGSTQGVYLVDSTPPNCDYVPNTPADNSFVHGTIGLTVHAEDDLHTATDDKIGSVWLIEPKPTKPLKDYDRTVDYARYVIPTYDTTLVADGAQIFETVCTDVFQNARHISRTLTVDNAGPTPVTIAVDPAPTVVGAENVVVGTRTITVNATDALSGMGTIQIYLSGGFGERLLASGSGSTLSTLLDTSAEQDGSYTIRAVASDVLGNSTTVTQALVFDKTPPVVTILSPLDGVTGLASISQIDATATDLHGIRSFQLTANGTPLSYTFSDPDHYTLTTPITAPGTYVLRAIAEDGAGNPGNFGSAQATVGVAGANHKPVAYDQSPSTLEDTPKPITLTASDQDTGDVLTYSVVTQPAHGKLSGSGQNLTYTPDPNYNGTDSFTFKANDGKDDSNIATVTITVIPVNDPPTANSQSVTTNEDTPVNITLTGADVDSTPVFVVLTQPIHGKLTGSGANQVYTPDLNYNGADSFTFKTTDGLLDSDPATVSITVLPVNDPPVAYPTAVSAIQGVDKSITLVATDVDDTNLTYTVVAGPSHGSISSGTSATRTYHADATYTGTDSFTFKANDGKADSNLATITITVGAANGTPVASNSAVTLAEDTSATFDFQATDPNNDPLTYDVLSGPAHGTLSGTGKTRTYVPNPNYNGSDAVVFRANDGSNVSDSATVSITVTPVNDAPTAHDMAVSLLQDTSILIEFEGSDIDGDPLTYIVGTPSRGTISKDAAGYHYTPNPGVTGTDSFTYRADDGQLQSAPATVSVTIWPTGGGNNPPVASNGAVTTAEDTAVAVTLSATDPENDPLTYIVVQSPAHGRLSGSGQNLTYTPDANYNGTDRFFFKANDGHQDSNVAVVNLTITPVNDAPVAFPMTVSLDQDTVASFTLAGFDTEGSPLTYIVTQQPAHGTLSGTGAALSYHPNPGYTGSDAFLFKVNDGELDSAPAQVSITVRAVNHDPVAGNKSVTTPENTAIAIVLPATDADNDPLVASLVQPAAHGTLSMNGLTWTYTPNTNYSGADFFTYRVNDGKADSNVGRIDVTITAVNHPPVATPQSLSLFKDQSKAFTMTGTDVDNDPLTFAVVSGPSHGSISGTGATRTYTPNLNYVGPDQIQFTAFDGQATSSAAAITINVVASNNPPVAQDLAVATDEETPVDFTVTATDADNDPLTYQVVDGPANGTLTRTAGATGPAFRYTPNPAFHGSDLFTFRANDGLANSNVASVYLTVRYVNHPPQITILSPASGALVGGVTPIRLQATDVEGVDHVTVSIDNGPEVNATSEGGQLYIYQWDTTSVTGDAHVVHANVYDTDLVERSTLVNVTVDHSSPTITAFTPADGDTVGTSAQINVSASDDHQVASMEIRINGALVASMTGSGSTGSLPYSWAPTANGPCTIDVTVTDEAGNKATATHNVTVTGFGGDQPPQFTIIFPSNNAWVGGLAPFIMRIADNSSADTAGIHIDEGAFLAASNTPDDLKKYTYEWDTSAPDVTEGTHQIRFEATKGSASTSKSIAVRVDKTKPVVNVLFPAPGQVIYGAPTFRASITDNGELKHVEFTVNKPSETIIGEWDTIEPTNEYDHAFDTEQLNSAGDRIYADGDDYILTIYAEDQANNQTIVHVAFKIDNTTIPNNVGTITTSLPEDGCALNENQRTLSFTVTKADIDLTQANDQSFRVYYYQGGEKIRLAGAPVINGNTVTFNQPIPKDRFVEAVIRYYDTNGHPLFDDWNVLPGVIASDGATIEARDARLDLTFPPMSLPASACVDIRKPDDTSIAMEQDVASTGLETSGRVYAGPYEILATPPGGSPITNLDSTHPGKIDFAENQANIPGPEQAGFIFQFQRYVDQIREWRSITGGNGDLGASDVPKTRSVSVDIGSLGLFRVATMPAPQSGVTELLNLPNPFSPFEGGTLLQYQLGQDSDVTIAIYDLLGNLVRRWDIAAGAEGGRFALNKIAWDGRNGVGDPVGNGGYIARITAKGKNDGQTSKAIRKLAVAK